MISLFRELPFQIQFQGRPVILRFAAGFSKTVDPLSGMTVNLKFVNSWLEAWRNACQGKDFLDPCEMLLVARAFLAPLAATQGASLIRVQTQLENRDLLSQGRDEKYEFQKSWWITEAIQAKRVQVIAIFSVLNWADVERIQNLPIAESYRFHAEDLFKNFPLSPFSLEVKDPLTENSTRKDSK